MRTELLVTVILALGALAFAPATAAANTNAQRGNSSVRRGARERRHVANGAPDPNGTSSNDADIKYNATSDRAAPATVGGGSGFDNPADFAIGLVSGLFGFGVRTAAAVVGYVTGFDAPATAPQSVQDGMNAGVRLGIFGNVVNFATGLMNRISVNALRAVNDTAQVTKNIFSSAGFGTDADPNRSDAKANATHRAQLESSINGRRGSGNISGRDPGGATDGGRFGGGGGGVGGGVGGGSGSSGGGSSSGGTSGNR